MIKTMVSILLIFFINACYGKSPILQQYINVALENNLSLKQQEFSYQKSIAALKEARGLFLPSVNINARYSRAGGGRIIEFPVGDMMNPVYQSLNALLQQPRFPVDIENEQIPFLREEEQETKISAVQPLFHPTIYYNYKIKKKVSEIEKTTKDKFVRQLVAEVKIAYFNYLKTVKVVQILQKTEIILKENLRVSEKLFENSKATKEVVYRARAELSKLEQNKTEVEKNKNLAAAYFNFLLNRSLNEPIEVAGAESFPPQPAPDLTETESLALKNREELKQMELAIAAAKNGIKLSKAAFLPNVFAAFDYGFQGEEYSFTGDDDFWMASAVFKWNLFNGFQDKAKTQQASLEKKKYEAQLAEIKKQIQLQAREAYYNLTVAGKSIISAEDRLNSARKSFEIINKKYRQGMSPHIEYLDARNTLTGAEINRILTTFDYYIRNAELEKVTAVYPRGRKLNH